MNKTILSSPVTKEHLAQAIDYQAYRKMIADLLILGKTTGPNQSQELTDYTKINVQRMNRWDKTAVINEDLRIITQNLEGKWLWLVLTEGWCGDAAQNIPIIVKIAELNSNIELKFLLRDENLDLMNQYLTNGGKAIPKLIILKQNSLEEINTWGPRPKVIQDWVVAERKKPNFDYKFITETVHKWYAKNKAQDIQNEFLEIIQNLKK